MYTGVDEGLERRVAQCKREMQEAWKVVEEKQAAADQDPTTANVKAYNEAYAVYSQKVEQHGAADEEFKAELKRLLGRASESSSKPEASVLKAFGAEVMRGLAERKQLDASTGGLTLPRSFYDPAFAALPQGEALVRAVLPTVQVAGSGAVPAPDGRDERGGAAGDEKPESVYSAEKVDLPFITVAHVSEALDRSLLADWEMATTFIGTNMRMGVLLAEEDEILNGIGSPGLTGFLEDPDIESMSTGETHAERVYHGLQAVREEFHTPTAVIMHPAAWSSIRLARDESGGPGTGGYLAAGIVSDDPTRLWGVPVIQSTLCNSDKALVGDFAAGAKLYEREGVSVRFSEAGVSSDDRDLWRHNLIVWRAESRVQLAILQPAAFKIVDFIYLSD